MLPPVIAVYKPGTPNGERWYARPDVLRWATHGPTGDIVDDYTTLRWAAFCEEVARCGSGCLKGS